MLFVLQAEYLHKLFEIAYRSFYLFPLIIYYYLIIYLCYCEFMNQALSLHSGIGKYI